MITFIKFWWPKATLFAFIFLYAVDTIIHHSFIHKHSLRPIFISSRLSTQWAEPPWGAEPRFKLGPALQQASALPTEPHCTLLSHTAPIGCSAAQMITFSDENFFMFQDKTKDPNIFLKNQSFSLL
jgi:hypothetical protein